VQKFYLAFSLIAVITEPMKPGIWSLFGMDYISMYRSDVWNIVNTIDMSTAENMTVVWIFEVMSNNFNSINKL
jgi:hypothetical protein